MTAGKAKTPSTSGQDPPASWWHTHPLLQLSVARSSPPAASLLLHRAPPLSPVWREKRRFMNYSLYQISSTLALKSSPGFIFFRVISATDWPDWLHTWFPGKGMWKISSSWPINTASVNPTNTTDYSKSNIPTNLWMFLHHIPPDHKPIVSIKKITRRYSDLWTFLNTHH